MNTCFMRIILLLFSVLVWAEENTFGPYLSFPDWKQSHRLNTEVLESDAHNAFLDIYLNDLAYETYKNAEAPYQVGSIVYKPLYSDANRSECVRLVIMVKMEPGYDSEHGDWWYGVYAENGTEAWYKGRIRSCITCHEYAKEKDYMFSQSVLYKIKHPGTTTTSIGEIVHIP